MTIDYFKRGLSLHVFHMTWWLYKILHPMRQWLHKPTSREAVTGAYYDGVILRAAEKLVTEDTERQDDAVVTL